MSVTRTTRRQRIQAQTGTAKSVKLTPAEHERLKSFGSELDTQKERAKKLGVTREAYLRICLSGSGRGDYVAAIRKALKSEPVIS